MIIDSLSCMSVARARARARVLVRTDLKTVRVDSLHKGKWEVWLGWLHDAVQKRGKKIIIGRKKKRIS